MSFRMEKQVIKVPVVAVSKSMAMIALSFLSKLLDQRSVWRNPTSPRLFVNGLKVEQNFRALLGQLVSD